MPRRVESSRIASWPPHQMYKRQMVREGGKSKRIVLRFTNPTVPVKPLASGSGLPDRFDRKTIKTS